MHTGLHPIKREDAKLTYLSDKQLAVRFSVARQTIWRWVNSDRTFPSPYSLSASCTRWKLEEVERWEQSRAKSHPERLGSEIATLIKLAGGGCV